MKQSRKRIACRGAAGFPSASADACPLARQQKVDNGFCKLENLFSCCLGSSTAEQLTLNQLVVGSNPSRGTNRSFADLVGWKSFPFFAGQNQVW